MKLPHTKKILESKQGPICHMLDSLSNQDENFYYSVPRPYKSMIDQATEINQHVRDLRKGKASDFKMR